MNVKKQNTLPKLQLNPPRSAVVPDGEVCEEVVPMVPVVPQAAPWRCPRVYVLDPVLYYENGNLDAKPTAAFVTNVNETGDGNITLTTIPRNSEYIFPLRKTVLHKDDPRLLENPDLMRNGVWDLHFRDKFINRLMEMFPEAVAEP
jgi:hypothetical protein